MHSLVDIFVLYQTAEVLILGNAAFYLEMSFIQTDVFQLLVWASKRGIERNSLILEASDYSNFLPSN